MFFHSIDGISRERIAHVSAIERMLQQHLSESKESEGRMSQKHFSADAIERTHLVSAKKLSKAIDAFNGSRILRQGGQGTVYKGMLTDGKIRNQKG